MYCHQCGKQIQETDNFCAHCAAPQNRREPSASSTMKGVQEQRETPMQPEQESAEPNEIVQLIQRVMKGDTSAWEQVYDKTKRYVYCMTRNVLRSEKDAEDVTQDIYLQVLRSIDQLDRAESFFAWLRRIVHSKCQDFMKKKAPQLLDEESAAVFEEMPEIKEDFLPDAVLDNQEHRRMILELVDALPYYQRQAVMFRYYEGITVEQIAQIMECPAGTVKSRLNYARQQIKKGVEEHEKTGVKLYGTAALPVLALLLQEQARNLTIPQVVSGGLASLLHQAGTTIKQILESAAPSAASGAESGALTPPVEAGAPSVPDMGAVGESMARATEQGAGVLWKLKSLPIWAKILSSVATVALLCSPLVILLPDINDTGGDGVTDTTPLDPLSDDVKQAYIKVLEDNEKFIKDYDWSNIDKKVAIIDICGDSIPELVFFASYDNGFTAFPSAKFCIYSYSDGQAKVVFDPQIFLDTGSTGSDYALYIDENGKFCLYLAESGQDIWTWREWFCQYELTSDLENNNLPDEGHSLFYWVSPNSTYTSYVERFSENEDSLTKDQYIEKRKEAISKIRTVIMSGSFSLEDPDWIIETAPVKDKVTQTESVAMTYIEALRFLGKVLDDPMEEEMSHNLIDTMPVEEYRSLNKFFDPFTTHTRLKNIKTDKDVVGFGVWGYMDGNATFTIPKEKIEERVRRYFGVKKINHEAVGYNGIAAIPSYRDGFYSSGGGTGWVMINWCNVSELTSNGDGTFTATVDLYDYMGSYEVSPGRWATTPAPPSNPYDRASEWDLKNGQKIVEADGPGVDANIYKTSTDTVILRPYVYNGVNTWQIMTINGWRVPETLFG